MPIVYTFILLVWTTSWYTCSCFHHPIKNMKGALTVAENVPGLVTKETINLLIVRLILYLLQQLFNELCDQALLSDVKDYNIVLVYQSIWTVRETQVSRHKGVMLIVYSCSIDKTMQMSEVLNILYKGDVTFHIYLLILHCRKVRNALNSHYYWCYVSKAIRPQFTR